MTETTTTTTALAPAADRVQAGAAWLDEHYPGWLGRIDLRILDMTSVSRCISAQAISPDGSGRVMRQIPGERDLYPMPGYYAMFGVDGDHPDTDAIALGFGLPDHLHDVYGGWQDLADAWTRLIQDRKVRAEHPAASG